MIESIMKKAIVNPTPAIGVKCSFTYRITSGLHPWVAVVGQGKYGRSIGDS